MTDIDLLLRRYFELNEEIKKLKTDDDVCDFHRVLVENYEDLESDYLNLRENRRKLVKENEELKAEIKRLKKDIGENKS